MTGLTSLSGANTTGSLQVSINDTITSFTGGAGRNIVEISAADATKVINLGTNSANQLLLTGDGSVYIGTGKLTTTNVTGYTQLGVADVTANTTYTYDVSKFAAGVNTLEVWAYTAGSINNFTGVANNTNLVIDGAATTSVVLASGLSGTSSAINVTLNGIAPLVGTGTIGYATTALSLADINGFGVGTVNFTTDASVGGGAHTLTTFTDANLANLNISGTGALVVTGAFTTNVIGTLTINDNDTSTAATTFTGGVTGNSLTNINFTGSHAVNLGALTDNLASISISNVNTGTTGVATITGHTDANLSSLTLSGSIALTGTYALNGAASVSGASDNSIVSLTMSGGGNKTITLGNGNDSVTTAGGVDTINLGNGNNTVVSGAGADVITLGTGANTVTPGAGADRVTFGTHASGVVDAVVVLATSETYSAATAATIVSATTALTGIDTFTGMRTGDTFSIAGISNTFTGATATTIAGATGTAVSLVRGSFNTTSNVFTTSSTGADTLLVYDADAAGVATVVEAVALIGYVGSGTVAAGVLTLG